MARKDDGTLTWWLNLVDQIERIPTKEGRQEHVKKVRAAIGDHGDRLVRWNLQVCDSLDISCTFVR
jgi:16S rRNA U516 pseudouridylate synthase RsuA-like enzyme